MGLTTSGWIFLVASWGAVIALTLFSFKRVLGSKKDKGE